MVQKRRIAGAGIVMPSCGTSRSRKVWKKAPRQARLSFSDGARVGAWKTAAPPERPQVAGTGLRQVEAGHVDELDAASQRLGHAAHDVGRSAAEDEKTGVAAGPVHEDAEDVEELRANLNLVQHGESPNLAQDQFGVAEPANVSLRFEVEDGCVPGRDELPGQRRLAALAGSEQGRDRRPVGGGRDSPEVLFSGDHGAGF